MSHRVSSVPGNVADPSVPRHEGESADAEPDRLQVVGLRLATVVVVLLIWELLAGRWLDVTIFSSPSIIWSRFTEMIANGELWRHTRVTLIEVGVGYPIGCVAGLLLAWVFGRYTVLANAFETLITATYGIPKTALAPLFIVWFGIGIGSKIAIVIMMSFFLVFFNTYSGFRHMDRDLINLARIMGGSSISITYEIVMPALLPSIMVGLRTSLPQALIGATVGEFIAAASGLGYLVKRAAALFDPGAMFVGIFVMLAIVMIGNGLLILLERRLMRWKPVSEVNVTL